MTCLLHINYNRTKVENQCGVIPKLQINLKTMTKFSRTQKFTKANIANVPQDKAIIYKIKSKDGENLYTGIAGRGRSQDRLIEHKDIKKEQIPEGTRFQYAQVKTKDRAHQIEKSIIKKEQPEHNEQHK
ncbi:MAG: hypothetical protein UX53_C0030G0012 [Candidatus Azambacteria bacterium GW2011_GWB2_46_37]|uniref:GIY-YIG domain-containing protein n=1 Tax=Candidatus Azambacteria bacterium GW2011_GWB2_46_37 TaxID=1618618 RepID=A0A0G1Q038_9BACT|nr:MAG: hypothetical protein UX53_C0030G0012 [Candidatus Azambacteria bacterium GW2011_GWB2_46_37]